MNSNCAGGRDTRGPGTGPEAASQAGAFTGFTLGAVPSLHVSGLYLRPTHRASPLTSAWLYVAPFHARMRPGVWLKAGCHRHWELVAAMALRDLCGRA